MPKEYLLRNPEAQPCKKYNFMSVSKPLGKEGPKSYVSSLGQSRDYLAVRELPWQGHQGLVSDRTASCYPVIHRSSPPLPVSNPF